MHISTQESYNIVCNGFNWQLQSSPRNSGSSRHILSYMYDYIGVNVLIINEK